MSDPIITLRGERVGLGPVTRAALPFLQQWWNDPKIMVPLSGQVWPTTDRDCDEWYEKYGARGDGSQVHFLVYLLTEQDPIGHVNLFQINYRSQTAWAAGLGDKRYWGRDYSIEAARLLLGYAFDVLGLHNVSAAIHADNRGSLRAAEAVGYTRIGIQRQSARKNGTRVDAVLLDILADDWRAAR